MDKLVKAICIGLFLLAFSALVSCTSNDPAAVGAKDGNQRTAHHQADGVLAAPSVHTHPSRNSASVRPIGVPVPRPVSATESDRKALLIKSNQYFGAPLSGDSRFTEVPTEADWLASMRMTDSELEDRAKTGSAKDKILWADRLISRAEQNAASGKTGSTNPDPGLLSFMTVSQLMSESRSPFVAYLYGRQRYALADKNPAYIVGALQAGYARGDTRAKERLVEFEAAHPGVDEEVVRSVVLALQLPPDKK